MSVTEKNKIDATVKEQILAIRETGLANMFDVNAVQRLAFESDFYELVCFIEENRKSYINFIFQGDDDC